MATVRFFAGELVGDLASQGFEWTDGLAVPPPPFEIRPPSSPTPKENTHNEIKINTVKSKSSVPFNVTKYAPNIGDVTIRRPKLANSTRMVAKTSQQVPRSLPKHIQPKQKSQNEKTTNCLQLAFPRNNKAPRAKSTSPNQKTFDRSIHKPGNYTKGFEKPTVANSNHPICIMKTKTKAPKQQYKTHHAAEEFDKKSCANK